MAAPAVVPVDCTFDEGGSEVRLLRRVTRENRQLWYRLKVIQEPQHARACGAGTKANSDRRPVDPPPVVELRIKEGPSFEEGKEITFDYNASFFLYASLEQSRKIAPGRVQSQPNPPILTGVPASGMAYLDRPIAAGYFIFPDLSVRHEGQYKLAFSLFETTKEEKDYDLKPPDGNLPVGVDWRMEIKTKPFDVYSAKKFPGLLTSTPLSQQVADQGCRVRIRREVRMRKRETKGNGHDRRAEDVPHRRTVTPASEDPHAIRARSISNASEQRAVYPDPHRRPSVVDAYPPPPPPPGPRSYDPTPRGHLSFGDHHGMPQYAAPTRHYSQQSLAPISPGGPYAPTGHPHHYIKPEPSSYGYAPSDRSIPASPAIKPDHERHLSGSHIPSSPSIYSAQDGHMRRDSRASYPSTPITPYPSTHLQQHLPAAQIDRKPMNISHLMSDVHLPPIEPQNDRYPEPPPVSTGGKRKHEIVFSQSNRPLHNGQRQMDPHYSGRERSYHPDPDRGSYTRADGTVHSIPFNSYTLS